MGGRERIAEILRGDCKQMLVGETMVASPNIPALPSGFLGTWNQRLVGTEAPERAGKEGLILG